MYWAVCNFLWKTTEGKKIKKTTKTTEGEKFRLWGWRMSDKRSWIGLLVAIVVCTVAISRASGSFVDLFVCFTITSYRYLNVFCEYFEACSCFA